MPAGSGQYDDRGVIVCTSCAAAPQIQAVQSESNRKTQSMFIGALSSVGIGALSFCIQHKLFFFLFPAFAIISGVGIAFTCLRSNENRRLLGWRYAPTLIAAILGALLGVASLALSLFVRLLVG